ncbi:bifunctional DNA-formamidopyrimidine glycosylase/DNA-(apurinic or apyrimidinic site) lyase [Endothiovibrio diazotrophicus]
MPELPEVETTRRGIAPHLEGHTVAGVDIRQRKLRRPIPQEFAAELTGQRIEAVERRAKYLLLRTAGGSAILHLGMSGSLRLVEPGAPPDRHDHVDIRIADGRTLRYTDPRRFGLVLWTRDDPLGHPLLAPLGPEPLTDAFDGERLFRLSRGRKGSVKAFIMEGKIVVGVGNIYASESLFLAGVAPRRAAGRVSRERYDRLAGAIKAVLARSIEAGGTTLRDFVGGDGKPGYFAQQLNVYGRGGEPCPACGALIHNVTLAQRSTYYCPRCQR